MQFDQENHMGFNAVMGQTRVKRFFQKALEAERLSHAYLFVGERGVGKEAMALEVARALFCSRRTPFPCGQCRGCRRVAKLSHPDLVFVFPAPAKVKESDYQTVVQSVVADPYQRAELWANPSISIDKVREIRRSAAYKSLEGRGRVIVLGDAERMTNEAANALLKLLEEPPDKSYLILISSRPNLLLPTIVSRCQVVKFAPLTPEEMAPALVQRQGVEEGRARLVARLAGGSYRRALELLDEDLNALREISLTLFRRSVQKDFTQLLFVDELLHTVQRDARKIKDLLTLLGFWLRDALIFQQNPDVAGDQVVNYDRVEVLQRFAENFPDADLYSAVQEVERSLELMDRNVQLNLILIVLLNKLRVCLRA